MELYDVVARQAARQLTLRYSTSFGMASRLFGPSIRDDVYAIYGLVRIADELVDSYRGADAAGLLRRLEADVYAAIERGFSTDLIIHAFVLSARRYAIGRDLIQPFFASMAMDLQPGRYDRAAYRRYIHGSAEVVGLMCLRVFCNGDQVMYERLAPGAQALGAAFQKVNFLRDLADDRELLGRNYFPELQDEELSEDSKAVIIADIEADFTAADPYIGQLPPTARAAVVTSWRYYRELLYRLKATPAAHIRRQRIRVAQGRKLRILAGAAVRRRLGL